MTGDFFVILNHPSGGIVHMSKGGDNDLATFEFEEDAVNAAENSFLGESCGYEVFEMGFGSGGSK